jgi:hypothetical protein
MSKKYNVYKDYYQLPFTKIYWSKLVDLYIVKESGMEVYKCVCCVKHPLECENKESVREYQKIQDFMEAEPELFVFNDVGWVIRDTGYIRTDMFYRRTTETVWRIQRELANKAGFKMFRSPFM